MPSTHDNNPEGHALSPCSSVVFVKQQVTTDESVDSDHPSFPSSPLQRQSNNNDEALTVNTIAAKISRQKLKWILFLIGIPIVAALIVWLVIAKASFSRNTKADMESMPNATTTTTNNDTLTPEGTMSPSIDATGKKGMN